MEILISAGHSDVDPGAVNGSYTEARLVTELRDIILGKLAAMEVKAIGDNQGVKGKNLPLTEAMKLAKGRLAIELHMNAGINNARGVESISLPPLKQMSQKITQSIASILDTKVRGDNGWIDQSQSQHSRLGFVNAGGIIVEVCFISNDDELRKYLAKKNEVADVIIKCLLGK